MSRNVPKIHLGIVGSPSSGKSALVHRYLTGKFVQDESQGTFDNSDTAYKKTLTIVKLLFQFSSWVDAVVFVFSLENEQSFETVINYHAKISEYRNICGVPLVLVGTLGKLKFLSSLL